MHTFENSAAGVGGGSMAAGQYNLTSMSSKCSNALPDEFYSISFVESSELGGLAAKRDARNSSWPKQELDLYGIFRIDNEGKHYHGWTVQITRKGKLYHKSFSDRMYGGREAALMAAKCFRNEIIDHIPLMEKSAYASIVKKNNTSGVAGVFKCETRSTKGVEKIHRYWCAQLLSKSGIRKRKKFSIEKFGERVAFEMACSARDESLAELGNIQHANSSYHYAFMNS